MGLFSRRACANASSPHGYQSTGLFACWSRYGLVSPAKRLGTCGLTSACNLRGHFLESYALEIGPALKQARDAESPLGARVETAQMRPGLKVRGGAIIDTFSSGVAPEG